MSKPKLLQKNAEEELSLEETSHSPLVEEKCINIPSDRKYSLFGAKNVALSRPSVQHHYIQTAGKLCTIGVAKQRKRTTKLVENMVGCKKETKSTHRTECAHRARHSLIAHFSIAVAYNAARKMPGAGFTVFLGGMQRKVFRFETPCKDSFALC